MAIIFENQSKCAICGEVLNHERKYMAFPPLISNTNDPLFLFSDNGVHIECLNNHLLGVKAIFFMDQYYKGIPLVDSVCIIDGQIITNPKAILSFGLLTSNENELLFKFNFLIINKINLNKWQDKNEFIDLASNYIKEGKWNSLTEFNYLDYLITKVSDGGLYNPRLAQGTI